MDIFSEEFNRFLSEPFKILKKEWENTFFEFYKLKDEVISLLRDAKRRGFDDILYCELTLRKIQEARISTETTVFYRIAKEDKAQKFSRKSEYEQMEGIPEKIETILNRNNFVTLKIRNIVGVLLLADETVKSSTEFEKLIPLGKEIEKRLNLPFVATKRTINLKDELFFTRVTFSYFETDGGEKRRKIFNYSTIKKIPDDIRIKLESNENSECTISF